MTRLSPIILAVGTLLCLAAPDVGFAQGFPTRPVHLVMPYSPGGIVDYVGRVIARALSEELGQPVVSENRPGAGGIAGTEGVARSQPDGYTLLIMDPAIVINPTLQPKLHLDLFRQLMTISMVSSSPEVLVVSPRLPVKTVQELIAYAKANPGKLNYASAGVGTTPHLGAELFKQRAGIEATHVPYRSIGQSFPDMMTDKVQFAFSSIAGALPFTQDNRVRALATTGPKRSKVYPDQPTMEEAGLSGFQVDLWLGIFAPAGVPQDVAAKLSTALSKALKRNDVIAALATVGVEPRGTSPEEGAVELKSEFEKWKHVIETAKISLN